MPLRLTDGDGRPRSSPPAPTLSSGDAGGGDSGGDTADGDRSSRTGSGGMAATCVPISDCISASNSAADDGGAVAVAPDGEVDSIDGSDGSAPITGARIGSGTARDAGICAYGCGPST